MSTLEANLALLLTIPEERQEEIQNYLLINFCADNPYKPLSGDEILRNWSSRGHVIWRVKGKILTKSLMRSVTGIKFVVLYRIQDDTVIVDGMFHELQDYEGIFTDELHLR